MKNSRHSTSRFLVASNPMDFPRTDRVGLFSTQIYKFVALGTKSRTRFRSATLGLILIVFDAFAFVASNFGGDNGIGHRGIVVEVFGSSNRFPRLGSDRMVNAKERRAYALDFGFRDTDDSDFLPAEGESATFWATCLRELIEEAARICIPFLTVGAVMDSSESCRARLIGDGPGRLRGAAKVNQHSLRREYQRGTYGTSTFFGPLLEGTLRYLVDL
jgi:hypothetical protein